MGENSQLVISILGPGSVSPGDTAEINVSYSAIEGQEIVVWFQLDQSPFTTFQEFRQAAMPGQNDIVAKLFIPESVPIAQDAYQYQTILVPTGGGWPERISNVSQRNIDVVMVSSVRQGGINKLDFNVYPNPTTGLFNVEIPASSHAAELILYSALGREVHRQTIPSGRTEMNLNLSTIPRGVYWLSVQQDNAQGVVKFLKQ